MSFWKDVFDIVQAITTSVGIVIGGIWTYLLFVRQRLAFPKVNIDILVDDEILCEGTRLVHVEIRLENVGNVVLLSNYAELRLRKVIPIPEELKPDIEKGIDPVQVGKTEIEWPMIAGREWRWDKGDFEIEPGEPDSHHADYIIPTNVQVVEFYYFVSNAKKKRQGIGWTLTKIHKFYSKEDGEMTDSQKQEKGDTKKLRTQQQRQQKQQQQQRQQQQTQPKKKDK